MPRAAEYRSLRAVARRQRGLFTLPQAMAAGFSRAAAQRLVGGGTWIEVAPRVYRTALAAPLNWIDRLLAEALACDGVACGPSAAALYGLMPPPDIPHVLVARARRSHAPAGRHTTQVLPPADRATVQGVPATTPIRTLLDVAGSLDGHSVEALVDRAVVRGLVRPDRLEVRARELWAPRRAGCAAVLRALADQHPDLGRARNEWEAKILRLSRAAGLPDPVPNLEVRVGGRRRFLDSAWVCSRVCCEFDGFRVHGVRAAFDDDRARQNDVVAAGWEVYRLTSTALTRNGDRAFAPVAAAVHRRAAPQVSPESRAGARSG